MSPEDLIELTDMAKGTANAVWARLKSSAPSYPALEVWLALAAKLRAEGKAEPLTPEGHRVFVAAYEAELKVLARPDLNAQLAELGKEAAREAWVEYAGQLNQIPNYPELNAWRKVGADLWLLENDRVLNELERRAFVHAYRNELQVLDAEEHRSPRGK